MSGKVDPWIKVAGAIRGASLCLVLVGLVSGCAPLTKGAVAMSGGGTSGSSCDYDGLFRGSNCLNSVTHVYIADKNYGDKIPRVCGSLTTWGLLGAEYWRPGDGCYNDVPSFCKSDVLVPGFTNEVLEENNAVTVSRLNKSTLCSSLMTAQLFFSSTRRSEEKFTRIWGRMQGRDAMGRKIDIQVTGDDIDKFCESSVIFPSVDDKVLAEYGVLKDAERKKKVICKDPKRYKS